MIIYHFQCRSRSYRDVHSLGCSLQTRNEGGQNKHRRVCQHYEGGPYEYDTECGKFSHRTISFFWTFNIFRKIWHLLFFYFKEKDLILHFSNNGLFTSWQKLKIKQFVSIYRTNINFFTMFFMKPSEERVNFFPKTTSLEKWTARHCRTKLWTCLDFEKSSWLVNWTLNPKVFIDIY